MKMLLLVVIVVIIAFVAIVVVIFVIVFVTVVVAAAAEMVEKLSHCCGIVVEFDGTLELLLVVPFILGISIPSEFSLI